MSRTSRKKPLLEKILIFAEGPTEVNYFEQLRQNKNISNATVVQILKGAGDYVDKAEQNMNSFKTKFVVNRKILVFDANHQSSVNLTKLVNKAYTKGYEVAFSNTCFEVWLLSHFETMTPSVIDEKKLCKQLTSHLKTKYKKADTNQLAQIVNNIDIAQINTASINKISYNWQSTNVGALIATL